MVTIDASTPQLKVVQKWIDAYIALDVGKIDPLFSKGYKHQILPKSIGLGEETKEEYAQRFGRVLPVFSKFEPTIHEVIEAPGKVIIHATNICHTIYPGVTLTYEAMYTLSFVEEDGELEISRCKEFIDTQEYGSFTEQIAKAVTEGLPAP